MPKFLIIQTAFIGDVVLATGLIEKLHAFFPGAEIDFLVRKGNEGLLKGHPFLHQVLVWDKTQKKLPNLRNMLGAIRAAGYDKVINLQRFAATGLLTSFSGAKERIGFRKNPFSFLFSKKIPHVIAGGKHEIERNNDLIKSFTDDIAWRPKLYPQAGDYELVKQYKDRPYICIAPTSVWFTKQYPADKWISFIRMLPTSFAIYLLGAPSDKAICDEILAQCAGHESINLCGKLNFLQSAALMRDAAMNYVNDSAPLHFASAVNAPVTAVYCSTLPSFGFGPLSDKSIVVEIQETLSCRPCGLHGRKACPLGHFHCAYKIRESQLLAGLGIPLPA